MQKENWIMSVCFNAGAILILIFFAIGVPYDYYFILKMPLFILMLNQSMLTYASKRRWLTPLYLSISLAFIPFVKYPIKRAEWVKIDIVVVVVLLIILVYEAYKYLIKRKR